MESKIKIHVNSGFCNSIKQGHILNHSNVCFEKISTPSIQWVTQDFNGEGCLKSRVLKAKDSIKLN